MGSQIGLGWEDLKDFHPRGGQGPRNRTLPNARIKKAIKRTTTKRRELHSLLSPDPRGRPRTPGSPPAVPLSGLWRCRRAERRAESGPPFSAFFSSSSSSPGLPAAGAGRERRLPGGSPEGAEPSGAELSPAPMGDSVFGERPALRYAVSAARGRGRGRGRLRAPLPRGGPEQVPAGWGAPGAGGRSPRLSRARGRAAAEEAVGALGKRGERGPGASRPCPSAAPHPRALPVPAPPSSALRMIASAFFFFCFLREGLAPLRSRFLSASLIRSIFSVARAEEKKRKKEKKKKKKPHKNNRPRLLLNS